MDNFKYWSIFALSSIQFLNLSIDVLQQACRGHKLDAGVPVYIETDGGASTIMNPVTADFITMFSTVPGMC